MQLQKSPAPVNRLKAIRALPYNLDFRVAKQHLAKHSASQFFIIDNQHSKSGHIFVHRS
jgi:hypothetical protein